MSTTILCVDDSTTMQTVCEITFRASDYEYVGARSADEALKKARAQRPNLVLVDADMPGKTGYDLCREFKADPGLAGVPVVLMTGNSISYDEGRGAEVGADGYLTKPWDTAQLIDQVGKLIAKGASQPAPAPRPAPAPVPAARPAPPRAASVDPGMSAHAAAPRPAAPSARPAAPARQQPAARPAPTAMGMEPRASARAATPLPQPPAGMNRPPMIKGTPSKRPATPVPQAVRAAPAASPPRSPTLMGIPSAQIPGMAPAPPITAKPPGVTSISSRRPAQSPADEATSGRGLAERSVAAVPAVAQAVARDAGLDPSGPEMRALLALSREVVERVVWEVVPDLAESIIRENLDRLAAQSK